MVLIFYSFLMAVTYALLVGFSIPNLIIGYVLGIIILSWIPQLPSARAFLLPHIPSGKKLPGFFLDIGLFVWDFLVDLTISNFQIAWDVLTPTDHFQPTLIQVPVGDLTKFELMILASRITLTPGTLSVDVTADQQQLVVHVMYPGKGDIAKQLRKPIDLFKGKY